MNLTAAAIEEPTPLARRLAQEHRERRRRLYGAAYAAPVQAKEPEPEPEPAPAEPEPCRVILLERIPDADEPSRSVLFQCFLASRPPPVTLKDITRAVSSHYHISVLDLVSQRRTGPIVLPRQIVMYLAKVMTPRSYPQIGRAMGGRDHTTAMHAVRKITAMVEAGDPIAADVQAIRDKLEGRS